MANLFEITSIRIICFGKLHLGNFGFGNHADMLSLLSQPLELNVGITHSNGTCLHELKVLSAIRYIKKVLLQL